MASAAKQGNDNRKWSTCQTCGLDYTGEMQMLLAMAHIQCVIDAGTANDGVDDMISATRDISFAMMKSGNYAMAEELTRSTHDLFASVLGDNSPDALQERGNIAACMQSAGKFAEADLIYADLIPTMRRVLGDDHRFTMSVRCNASQGRVLRGGDDIAEAMDVVTKFTAKFGPNSPKTLSSQCTLVAVMVNAGFFTEAETTQVDTVEKMRRVLGGNHPDTVGARMNLAWVKFRVGKIDEALRLQTVLCVASEHLFGEESMVALDGKFGLARMMWSTGVTDAKHGARDTMECISSTAVRLFGVDHPASRRYTEFHAAMHPRSFFSSKAQKVVSEGPRKSSF
jgi:hypothetical protein